MRIAFCMIGHKVMLTWPEKYIKVGFPYLYVYFFQALARCILS